MRLSAAFLLPLLAWAPQARAVVTLEPPARLVLPGQQAARPACAACSLILPAGTPALPQTAVGPQSEIIVPAQAEHPSLIQSLSAQFGPAQPGQARPEPAAALPALFDHESLQDGTRVSPAIVTPGTMAREPELAVARAELTGAVKQALPTLAESVKRGQWNGPNTSLNTPCCGDAAPKLGLLLRQQGYSVHVVEAEFHYYLLHSVAAGQIVIDPTIRQFFGGTRAPPSVPTVFVGTVAELHRLFAEHAPYKTTKYDMRRIYFREAATKDERLRELQAALAADPPNDDILPLRRFIAGLSRH